MSSQMLTLERKAIVCKALLWQIMMRVGRSCFEGLSDMRHFHLLPLILLAGCGDTGSSTNHFAAEENNGYIQNQARVNALPDNAMTEPLNPPPPGEQGGLDADNNPLFE